MCGPHRVVEADVTIAVSAQIVSSCVIFGLKARGALLPYRSAGLPLMNQP